MSEKLELTQEEKRQITEDYIKSVVRSIADAFAEYPSCFRLIYTGVGEWMLVSADPQILLDGMSLVEIENEISSLYPLLEKSRQGRLEKKNRG